MRIVFGLLILMILAGVLLAGSPLTAAVSPTPTPTPHRTGVELSIHRYDGELWVYGCYPKAPQDRLPPVTDEIDPVLAVWYRSSEGNLWYVCDFEPVKYMPEGEP